jgi:DNA-binding protein H-NS
LNVEPDALMSCSDRGRDHPEMAKMSLARLDVDALLKLRADIDRELSGRRRRLESQFARLGISRRVAGRGTARKRRKPTPSATVPRRHKVAPKYRGPGGEVWAGRGARPRWLVAAIKAGRELDDFRIDKTAMMARKDFKKRRKSKRS